ncbi:uncharacterized protein Dsimw501_GD27463 [Drosophila simulans]|uniref:Uncharacterized protein n=1 Tax=Drosophila simulans TaxID=7240 RepID=A0A0J9S1W8_DROSI|nr:uncharacterized protein Dsimw501_GD27463 [Drosophila simulans]
MKTNEKSIAFSADNSNNDQPRQMAAPKPPPICVPNINSINQEFLESTQQMQRHLEVWFVT